MKIFANPYIFGSPVCDSQQFFGRERELARIDNMLDSAARAGNALLIVGPRRIGKTSLLCRLANELSERTDVVTVFLNLQSIPTNTARDVLMTMLHAIVHEYQTRDP